MEEKDCIIGFSSNYGWDVLKFWVNSLNRSGFKGDKIIIVGNCNAATIEKLKENDIQVFAAQKINEYGDAILKSELAPHVERFFYIHNFLQLHPFYRYVLTTDIRDVIFQKNPMDYIEHELRRGDKLIVSSESIRYENEPWGNQNLMETFGFYVYNLLKLQEIFNVGILAGKYSTIKNLMLNIAMNSVNRPIKICDQAVFNFILFMSDGGIKFTKSEDGWACNLGTTLDPTKINDFRPYLLEKEPVIINDTVCVSSGNHEFYIVHQYDRNPQLRAIIEKKYA